MFSILSNAKRKQRGFTMLETLVVTAIIAVIATITIVSVVLINKTLKFTENNDYAKTIFIAAQTNLAEMRSNGELNKLESEYHAKQQEGDASTVPPGGYVYTFSSEDDDTVTGTAAELFDLVLPALSVDESIRSKNIIIEYSPKSGNVYSVFYSDKKDISEDYESGKLSRDEAERKKKRIGYCDGSEVTFDETGIYNINSSIVFENDQEATVSVVIPTQVDGEIRINESNYKNLNITITVIGEQFGGVFTKTLSDSDLQFAVGGEGGINTIRASFTLDNLLEGGFAQLDANKTADASAPVIYPGENISVTSDIVFNSAGDESIIMVKSSSAAGINPLFHSLTQDTDSSKYIIAIENGRHLQNLNAVHDKISENVAKITFIGGETNEIKWADTVAYYNNPAIKNFVSIDNQKLFGAYKEDTTAGGTAEGGTPEINNAGKAVIAGNGVKISGLAIEGAEGSNTGLFTCLNTTVENLNIENPVVKGGANVGALAGITGKHAVIKNCAVVTTPAQENALTITGTENVGGLVGKAVESKFEKTTSVLVGASTKKLQDEESTEEKVSALGGTVGYAVKATFADVRSGIDKVISDHIGGIAGVMDNGTVSKATVELKSAAAENNFGGIAAYTIDDITLTEVTVQQPKGEKTKPNTISAEDYAGGLIGNTKKSDPDKDIILSIEKASIVIHSMECDESAAGIAYDTYDVKAKDTTVFITGSITGENVAGAFGDIGSESELEKIQVKFAAEETEEEDDDKDFIPYLYGSETTGGFGVTLRGMVTDCSVMGIGVIGQDLGAETEDDDDDKEVYSANCAGFAIALSKANSDEIKSVIKKCIVAPETAENLEEIGITIDNLKVAGTGFIGTVGSETTVTESTALCTILKCEDAKHFFYDFATTNNGTISYSYANVYDAINIKDGKVDPDAKDTTGFIKTNAGTISHCYGWTNGKIVSLAKGVNNGTKAKITSSYFASLSTNDIELYDFNSKKSHDFVKTDSLADKAVLTLLNASGKTDWAYDKDSFPFKPSDGKYPYPMIREHMGTWSVPSHTGYDFGVLYYEKYSDGTYGIVSKALTKDTLIPYAENGKVTGLANDKTISDAGDAGYAIYVIPALKTSLGEYLGDEIKDTKLSSAANLSTRYALYVLKPTADKPVVSFTINGVTTSVNTNYAAAIDVTNNTYRIRTASQLQKIGTDGTYNIELNIAVKDFKAISAFKGTLNGNGKTISGLTTPLIATLDGGTVSNCNVSGSITTGTGAIGGLIGTAKGNATISNCTSSVEVSVTNDCGIFVGSAESTVTFTNCKSTAANANGLPFGNIAAATTTAVADATHYSAENYTEYSSSAKLTAITSAKAKTYKLTNCTFMLNGKETSALSRVYFYSVVTSETQTQTANTESLVKSDITYEQLFAGAGTELTETGYVDAAGNAIGVIKTTDSIDNGDGTTTETTTYTIKIGETETTVEDLTQTVSVYTKAYTLPTTGTFVLKAVSGSSEAISESTLWTAAAGGVWTSVSDPSVTITLTATDANTVTVNGEAFNLYAYAKTTTLTNLGSSDYLTGTAIQ